MINEMSEPLFNQSNQSKLKIPSYEVPSSNAKTLDCANDSFTSGCAAHSKPSRPSLQIDDQDLESVNLQPDNETLEKARMHLRRQKSVSRSRRYQQNKLPPGTVDSVGASGANIASGQSPKPIATVLHYLF